MKKMSYLLIGITILLITFIFSINIRNINTSLLSIRAYAQISVAALACLLLILNIKNLNKFPEILYSGVGFCIIAVVSALVNGNIEMNFMFLVVRMTFWINIFFIVLAITRNIENSMFPFNALSSILPYIIFLFSIVVIRCLVERTPIINSIYYVLLLLPIILSLKNNMLKCLGIISIFICIILSVKRTALIAFILGVFIYYIIIFIMAKRSRKRICVLFLALIMSIGLVYSFKYFSVINNIDFVARFQSLKTDGGSGRDVIWKNTIQMQLKSSMPQWLLGHGYNAVAKDSFNGLSAHNDILEIIYDYGLIALLLYFRFYIFLIKYFIKIYKLKIKLAAPFATSIVLFTIMSMTSHLIIYDTYLIYLIFFWGVAIRKYEFENKKYRSLTENKGSDL